MGPNGGEVLGLLAPAVHTAPPLDRQRTMIYAYPPSSAASKMPSGA